MPGLIFAFILTLALTAIPGATDVVAAVSQDQSNAGQMTPLQLLIERQRTRLGSAEQEERRDAVSQLGAMHHRDASRVAVAALIDPSPTVRATAASAILALTGEEVATNLIPLLSDKHEFVRREAAYALGKTGSASAVNPLIDRLLLDKEDGVRSAAAVALGEISSDAAVTTLAAVVSSQVVTVSSKKNAKSKKEKNPFVLRAAARSLGQIGSRAAVPALLTVLQDETADDDVRREAAIALGLIGDPAAIPALRNQSSARDPYFARAAFNAIDSIVKAKTKR